MLKPFQLLDVFLALKRRFKSRQSPAKGVLLLSCGGLGDTVLFALILPRLLELLKDGEPVTLLLRREAAKMAFLFPSKINVLAVDFARLRKDIGYRKAICEDLFATHYRLVVATDYLRHPILDETLVGAAAGLEVIAMKPRPWPKYDRLLSHNRRLYSRLFDSGPVHMDKVLRWAGFCDWATKNKQPPPLVRLSCDGLAPPAKLESPVVLIQPFSAVKQKQSPPSLYRRIIETLPKTFQVVITGAPSDMEENPEFRPLLDIENVSFNGDVFSDLVPLLRAADLVVSVDTALMHLSAALGAPTLCLASAAYIGEIVPYDPSITPDNIRFIYHPMDCGGCLGDCIHPSENAMYPCVARTKEDDVVKVVRQMLHL
jgi:hypothetical protein